MRNLSKRVLSAAMSVVLALGLCPGLALASTAGEEGSPLAAGSGSGLAAATTSLEAQEGDDLPSGTWGTCPWELTADGTLRVHPGEGGEPSVERNGYWRSYWFDYREKIKRIEFLEEDGAKVKSSASCSSLFNALYSVESIDLSGFDTSSATDMSKMFYGCNSLASLDLSSLDTSSATDMSNMFTTCMSLTSLDLSSLDTSSATNMEHMFYNCNKLSSVCFYSPDSPDPPSFDTSSVTDMGSMFSVCNQLGSLDLSSFDTSSATSMRGMFFNCSSLSALDISSFDTSSVTDMGSMFNSCSSLASLDLLSFDTSSATDMGSMFRGCGSLAALDLSSFDTSSVTNMAHMFNSCSSLASLDLSSLDTAEVRSFDAMFYDCAALETVYASDGFYVDPGANADYMFYGCGSLKGGNGTKYSYQHTDGGYARVDGEGGPGYFTEPTVIDPASTWRRVCGYNRYATAAAVARAGGWPEGGAVVLARGDDFRDALSASGLAGLLGAPVVTMPSGEGSRAFKSGMRAAANAIGRLQPSVVYVMGGEKALPSGLVEQACAQAPGAEVVRVSGANARLTSAAALEAGAGFDVGWSDTALVVTQQGFKDAVAAAPLAYALHMPIVLARDAETMDVAVVRKMVACGVTKAYLVGGPRALGQPVVDALERGGVSVLGEGQGPRYKGERMRKLAGTTAVKTSMAVAEFGIANGLSASTVGVAATEAFPDALSGAALCGRYGGVLVLAADGASASVTEFVPEHASEIEVGYVFGGSAVVSRATFDALVDATDNG